MEGKPSTEQTQKPSVLSRMWVLGSLSKVTGKIAESALQEMLYLLAWSTLPFWLGGLIGYATSDLEGKSFILATVSTFRNGELLVFTISTLAPTLFLMLHDPEGADVFPHKLPLSTIGVLTVVICAALFALLKSNTIRDVPFVFVVSIALSMLALLLRYVSMLYHRLRLPEVTEQTLRANETDFVEKFRRHVGDAE